MPMLPKADLNYILERTSPLWENLRNQRLFITGGTGFFGHWLLDSFAHANRSLNLDASAVILTRDASQATKDFSHLSEDGNISFYQGDVQSFSFPKDEFSYIIHAAADTKIVGKPLALYQSIINGTQHVLEFAKTLKTLRSFLFLSSGAVYGKQLNSVTHFMEDTPFGEVESQGYKSEYTPAKRDSELLCAQYFHEYNLPVKIARCFSVIGPCMPLNAHFSAGNFIHCGLQKTPIIVQGDGTPLRSWMYAADLAIWLWTILLNGENNRPYNVGSESAISIRDLAFQIAKSFSPWKLDVAIQQMHEGTTIDCYVPDVKRAQSELALSPGKDLQEAIHATIRWYQFLDSYETN